jgi:hypothetical protein
MSVPPQPSYVRQQINRLNGNTKETSQQEQPNSTQQTALFKTLLSASLPKSQPQQQQRMSQDNADLKALHLDVSNEVKEFYSVMMNDPKIMSSQYMNISSKEFISPDDINLIKKLNDLSIKLKMDPHCVLGTIQILSHPFLAPDITQISFNNENNNYFIALCRVMQTFIQNMVYTKTTGNVQENWNGMMEIDGELINYIANDPEFNSYSPEDQNVMRDTLKTLIVNQALIALITMCKRDKKTKQLPKFMKIMLDKLRKLNQIKHEYVKTLDEETNDGETSPGATGTPGSTGASGAAETPGATGATSVSSTVSTVQAQGPSRIRRPINDLPSDKPILVNTSKGKAATSVDPMKAQQGGRRVVFKTSMNKFLYKANKYMYLMEAML